MKVELPPINRQVNLCATLLGKAISHTHGAQTLELVESLRREAAAIRGTGGDHAGQRLTAMLNQTEQLEADQALAVAGGFSVYLALINGCENAYRTSRLRAVLGREAPPLKGCLIYVLTAHPTEIRSAPGIALMRRITAILSRWFARGADLPPLPDEEQQLTSLINLLWRAGIHKKQPVTPDEEIDHIAGQFSDEILAEILELRRRGADLRFRTWAGGDKDGHPGINAATLHTSFRRSRKRFHDFFKNRLVELTQNLGLLRDEVPLCLKMAERALSDIRRVTAGDGIRVMTLRRSVQSLIRKVKGLLNSVPLELAEMSGLLELFPAMVLPVELREESTIFRELQRKQTVGAIGQMLRKARDIAEGGNLKHYVQGLIISMTRDTGDIEAAMDVARRTVGPGQIPIIPLFERGSDLETAPATVDRLLSDHLAELYRVPGKPPHLEVMVGYSDTAKRVGAFAGRRSIINAMNRLLKVGRRHGVEVPFFHGAGGSVTRGGGSIEEQFAAWPTTARRIVKLTVQGEMVERTLATPEILRRNVERLLAAARLTPRPAHSTHPSHHIMDQMADISTETFRALTADPRFHRFVALATPYSDLEILHLGSRPSHRPGKERNADIRSLRAIPWVLCFTQVRLLVPSWYGVGTAFETLSQDPEILKAMENAYQSDMAFRGFVKLMGFSLSKGDPAVFSFFADTLAPDGDGAAVKTLLLEEEQRVRRMVMALSGENNLLWFRPWLSQSIMMRGSTIHPLSVLAVSALRKRHQNQDSPRNDELLRIAIAGTAVGMLTTG